jgi:hypothetical protein
MEEGTYCYSSLIWLREIRAQLGGDRPACKSIGAILLRTMRSCRSDRRIGFMYKLDSSMDRPPATRAPRYTSKPDR